MTLIEMTRELKDTGEMTGTNYAGFFNISFEQAERIAAKCETVADFLRIWENEDWWVAAH